jgi:RHS repeat-associated protein
MAGISDKALKTPYPENKYRFNDGAEMQNKEFSDGSGLEMYDANFRGYDPQIGRFWQIDPLADVTPDWSPYSFALDNPISFNDPLGLDADDAVVPAPPRKVPVQPPQCLTCQLPKPDPGGTVGPPPSSVPAPINYYSSDLSYLYDKFDNSPTVIAILGGINEYNPLANAVNAFDTYITGHDTRGRKQTNAQATVQLASVLPIGKAAVGLSMLENVVMGEGISVLGSYPGYIELADQLAARRFSIPVNIWNSMTPEQQWAANVKFLDRMISRGDNIVLSTSAFNAKAGTTFYRELQYLYSKGYKVSSGGMLLSK